MEFFFFFQAEDGIRDTSVTGVQTCALPIFAIRNRNALDAACFPLLLVCLCVETRVGRYRRRYAACLLPMLLHSVHQQTGITRTLVVDLVMRDDLIFRFHAGCCRLMMTKHATGQRNWLH